jgi:hypothetical protein
MRRATFTIERRERRRETSKQRRSHLGTFDPNENASRHPRDRRRREPTFRAGDLQSADRSRCALPIGLTRPEAHARRHAEA